MSVSYLICCGDCGCGFENVSFLEKRFCVTVFWANRHGMGHAAMSTDEYVQWSSVRATLPAWRLYNPIQTCRQGSPGKYILSKRVSLVELVHDSRLIHVLMFQANAGIIIIEQAARACSLLVSTSRTWTSSRFPSIIVRQDSRKLHTDSIVPMFIQIRMPYHIS